MLISLEAVAANWRLLAAASGRATTGAAIKADGYGLGARPMLDTLAKAGARDFFVASWAEAAALGAMPAGARLAVLHGITPAEMATAQALGPDVRPVLNTPAQVALWRQTGRPADVMIDTGINRLGLADTALLQGMTIDTLHSHLACAETPAHAMNRAQLAAFHAVPNPARRRALANSAGIALGPDWHFDLTRPGIGLYGGGPSAMRDRLLPVVAIEAPILQLRDVPAGASVGYGASFIAARPTRVAITALGYADGYPRAMATFGSARVAGVACPLIGRVSMDLTAFDVTDAPPLAEGDWLSVDFDVGAAAAQCNRAEYELLTGLGRRYARVYT
ncbi:alanine racemase [Polymorphobacter multimanifer]|uniref:alanine racemase n=1 Tax=Polymorphobacter multimanifer TaxID=1070431 RepID=UPI0027E4E5D4|nr:alanine racemase [Polymorphobacter multimanifer]